MLEALRVLKFVYKQDFILAADLVADGGIMYYLNLSVTPRTVS